MVDEYDCDDDAHTDDDLSAKRVNILWKKNSTDLR